MTYGNRVREYLQRSRDKLADEMKKFLASLVLPMPSAKLTKLVGDKKAAVMTGLQQYNDKYPTNVPEASTVLSNNLDVQISTRADENLDALNQLADHAIKVRYNKKKLMMRRKKKKRRRRRKR